jgi:O-antigen/teichoic acid export membrane protein
LNKSSFNIRKSFLSLIELFATFKKNILNAGLYFGGSIAQSLFALFAQPIYSKFISSSEFGILGYFDALKNLFAPIFIAGITTTYIIKFFNQNEEENKKMLFNITFYICIFNTILILISYLIIFLYFKALSILIPLYPFVFFMLSSIFFDNLKNIILTNYKLRRKAFYYFIFSTLSAILNFGLGILFVSSFEMGLIGRMSAPIVASILILPVCYIILKNYSIKNFSLSYFISIFKISLPLLISSYGFVLITNIDRFFLERQNDLSEFGLYNIGITIAGYLQLIYISLNQAFEPDILKASVDRNKGRIAKLFLVMFIPYSILILLFTLFSDNILSALTAGKFMGSKEYMNISIISVLLLSVFYFFEKILMGLDKPKQMSYVNLIGAIMAIIIMYLCTSFGGFKGGVYGKILINISLIFFSLIFIITSSKKEKYAL